MPQYQVWCDSQPMQLIDAPTSFAARKQYARLHEVALVNCAARRNLTPEEIAAQYPGALEVRDGRVIIKPKRRSEMSEAKTVYRLGSAEFVYAPGLVKWAINGAKFKKDRKAVVNVIVKTWNVPRAAATALLLEQVPYTLDGETVVFSH